MSVVVDLVGLQAEAERFGDLAYVVTVNDDGRPHVVSAAVAWADGCIVAGAGRRTASNVTTRTALTVLWPASDDEGYSLLVDGSAVVDGEQLRISPESAILHRTATSASGRRTSDCADIP